jgi:DDE family transposase
MRALEILRDQFRERLDFLHQKRWNIFWLAVEALIFGRRLWLTALGRALSRNAKEKHGIKAIDRLLGNKKLYRDRFRVAHAVASWLARNRTDLIVLIDTFEIRYEVIAVTASLAYDGRSFPIWSTTTGKIKLAASQCRRFLKELAKIIPNSCKPILVTDAGFESNWLEEVAKLGWDYVARVRGQTNFLYKGDWAGCKELHRLATTRPKNLGDVWFPKRNPERRRLVLSKLPKSKHRRVKTRRGPGNDTNYKEYRKNAHEPLLLATSLACRATQVVAIYQMRFQIEESFRDLKCHRWGWSLRHTLTRKRERLEILLLIAAIAAVAQQMVGIAADALGLARRFQSNTVSNRRVLSINLLGSLVLNSRHPEIVPIASLKAAIAKLRNQIHGLARLRE